MILNIKNHIKNQGGKVLNTGLFAFALSLGTITVIFSEQVSENDKFNSGSSSAGERLEADIVITGSRIATKKSKAVAPVDLFKREDIRSKAARDASDLLNAEPGIFVTKGPLGSDIQFQGLNSNYILFLKDGERMNGRVGGVMDLSRIRTEALERVEIIRGPASVLYGADAMAGVINFITKPSVSDRVEVTTQAGNLGIYDGGASVQKTMGDLQIKSAGGYRKQDAYKLEKNTEATSGRSIEDGNVMVAGGYQFNDRWRAELQSDYLQRDLQGVDQNEGSGVVFDRRNLSEAFQGIARLERQSSGLNRGKSVFRLTQNMAYYRDQFAYDQRGDDDLDDYQNTEERSWQSNAFYSRQITKANRISFGGEFFNESIETPRINPGFQERFRVAGYLEDEFRLGKKWTLAPGARIDHDSQFGNFISPRMAAKFIISKNYISRASAGMGFRSPSFRELYLYFENPSVGYVVSGNDKLRPEVARSLNLGLEAAPKKWLGIDFNGYFNSLSDLIQPSSTARDSSGPIQYRYQNVNEAYTLGADIRFTINFLKWFKLENGYAYLAARDLSKDRALEARPSHRGTLALLFAYQNWQARLQSNLVGSRPFYIDGETERLEIAKAYSTWDAKVEYALGKGFSCFIGAENITNAGHPEYLAILPRRFYFGARYLFESLPKNTNPDKSSNMVNSASSGSG